MAETKQVRVLPEDYEKISHYAEEKDISYAEAVHKMINEKENKGFMWGMLAGAGISYIAGNSD